MAGVAGNGQAALFDMLAGALAPASGEIVIDGARVSPVSPKEMMRRGVRCIPEDRFRQGLVGEMSISENLMLGRHRAAPFRRGPFVDYGAVDRVAATVIDAFRIATTGPQARAASLSGGNAQKVLLAREMAPGGRVLLAKPADPAGSMWASWPRSMPPCARSATRAPPCCWPRRNWTTCSPFATGSS